MNGKRSSQVLVLAAGLTSLMLAATLATPGFGGVAQAQFNAVPNYVSAEGTVQFVPEGDVCQPDGGYVLKATGGGMVVAQLVSRSVNLSDYQSQRIRATGTLYEAFGNCAPYLAVDFIKRLGASASDDRRHP
jgi:hypothetical protein